MSLNMEEGPLKEAAILTRAVENVFRKLIRLLVGRMSLTRLQEMIRIIFVEEAELKLKRERPGKNVAMSKLGFLTGLDTRTLNRILDENKNKQPLHTENRFLRDITPESNVLDYWSTNSTYLDPISGDPLELSLKGKSPSFESLINQVGSPRGVTMASILDRLTKSDSVIVDEHKQTVKLLRNKFLALEEKGNVAALEIGFVTVGYLVDTIVHNLDKSGEFHEPFFQRSNWTSRLNKTNLSKFRAELRNSLINAEQQSIRKLEEFDELDISQNQITAGVSLFYFEEDPSDAF